MSIPAFAHISEADTSLLIDFSFSNPQILHWGKSLGSIDTVSDYVKASLEPIAHAEHDEHHFVGIWRENANGNVYHPALLGHRSGSDFSQAFSVTRVDQSRSFVEIHAEDTLAGLEIWVRYEFVGGGVLRVSQGLKNLETSSFTLEDLSVVMPLGDQVAESLDFSGSWVKERQPNRRDIQPGIFSREVREGRSSHDYTIVQLAMTKGANYQTGEVWSLGLAFSGNSRHKIERTQTGRTSISASELLLPGEMILEQGESYLAPSVIASYSDSGIDGITNSIYKYVRSRPNHPQRPRPLTLNVWEAVYFDHNLEKLSELADVAKEIGVERFVLDDGWFGSRRDDLRGLGDWVISKDVWPQGLGPLIEKVKSCGMEFGLWFEGEMVNPDSDLYRAHPDWILSAGGRVPPTGRYQQVLNLTIPEAFEHVLSQVDAVLSENEIAYIKWDHNRFLIEAGGNNKPIVHEQTLAIYRLFDELKKRHPGLEIESCASGGGRIDLGMIDHADRFWTSDCNDALERQYIQRYTQIGIPPELLGSHIGPTKSHTTGRVHELSFRAITALFGHAGLEWDITTCTDDEKQKLKTWASYYKANRELIHSGSMVRVELVNPEIFVHGVVSKDKTKGLFAYANLGGQGGSKPGAIRFAGLNPEKKYHVKAVFPAGEPKYLQRQNVAWFEGIVLSGSALMHMGLQAPILFPENAFLIEIEAK
ncbi:MAG: alpha-galactosidase [Aquiluna sp.]|nr:alpha-galactosidase [Aquiluna sp.]